MDRLTRRHKDYIEIVGCKSLWPSRKSRRAHLQNAIIRLAEYEDAEEQGLLLRLPCKVGTPCMKLCTRVAEIAL